jgi:GPH family glycoside/pentoside/hexuronide:cation symporter
MSDHSHPAARFTEPGAWRWGLRYGAMGYPLAFVALPLYVLLPNHYAVVLGAPLAGLGLVLLGTRALDAFMDPWIGRWCDRQFNRSAWRVWAMAAVSALVMWLGLWALLFPPEAVRAHGESAVLGWAAMGLFVTSTAFSVATVAHQSWGARLGGNEPQRTRVVAWREGLSLFGVVSASILPSVAGLPALMGVFGAALGIGLLAWRWANPPTATSLSAKSAQAVAASPWQHRAFVRLLWVFVLNGTASAIPATLVLFFIQDRLGADAAWQGVFLLLYFLAAALSMPLWARAAERWGLVRSWLLGMGLSVAAFVWAVSLGTGDTWAFAAVCVGSGLALGADLSAPSALLNGVIDEVGERGRSEGVFFGWWSLATKLNLALAAGLALPLLAWWGYTPGATDPQALQTLTVAYSVLPCVLKLLAAALLYQWWVRAPTSRSEA